MTDTHNLKLRKAYNLIKAKQYHEARHVLTGVDHPKARQWLMRLDGLAPMSTTKQLTKKPLNKRKWFLVLILIILLLLACYLTVINPVVTQMNSTVETACFDIGGC